MKFGMLSLPLLRYIFKKGTKDFVPFFAPDFNGFKTLHMLKYKRIVCDVFRSNKK